MPTRDHPRKDPLWLSHQPGTLPPSSLASQTLVPEAEEPAGRVQQAGGVSAATGDRDKKEDRGTA